MSAKRIYHLTIAYDTETEEIEYLMEQIEGGQELILLGSSDFADYFKETQDIDEEIAELLEAFDNSEPGEA